MKEFFISHMTWRKYFLNTGRNIWALQVINCHKKKFLVEERNFRSQEEISYWRKKFLVTGRNFLSETEMSCTGRNILASEEISCNRKKLLVTGRTRRNPTMIKSSCDWGCNKIAFQSRCSATLQGHEVQQCQIFIVSLSLGQQRKRMTPHLKVIT